MNEREALKRRAAGRALDEVRSGMVMGLGTGSTVQHLLELLATALGEGRITDIRGIPTSECTREAAEGLGIPLTSLAEHVRVDLTIDGADEIDPALNLTKGLGGALLREKMIAQASDRFLVIADEDKLVPRLGSRSPVPVEVVRFEFRTHVRWLEERKGRAVLRTHEDGSEVVTDNGNLLLDCWFDDAIEDPSGLNDALNRRAGVVEHGLFLGLATAAYVARASSVEVICA